MTLMIVTDEQIRSALGLTLAETNNESRLVNLVHAPAENAVKTYLGYSPVQATRTEYYPPVEDLGDDWPIHGYRDLWESDGVRAFRVDSGRRSRDPLIIHHLPIRSITEIHEDKGARGDSLGTDFPAQSLLTPGTDYFFDIDRTGLGLTGIIWRAAGSWSRLPRTIRVQYLAGYAANEFQGLDDIDASAIRQAVLLTAVKMFKGLVLNQKGAAGFLAGPLKSEKLGDYSYTIGDAGLKNFGSFGFDGGMPPEEAMELLEPFVHFGTHVI